MEAKSSQSSLEPRLYTRKSNYTPSQGLDDLYGGKYALIALLPPRTLPDSRSAQVEDERDRACLVDREQPFHPVRVGLPWCSSCEKIGAL
jgi:hypothetical protein